MAYTDQAAMVARFGEDELRQLTDRATPPQGQIVAEVLGRAIDDAGAMVDSYLGSRYSVPLADPLPQGVERITCDIARRLLHDLSVPEPVADLYEQALRWLREVASGKAALIGSAGQIVTARTQAFSASAVAPYAQSAVFGDSFAQAMAP